VKRERPHEDIGAEFRDRGRELAEARGVIDGVARDQANARAVLVGEAYLTGLAPLRILST
jgi:hypothetical protein